MRRTITTILLAMLGALLAAGGATAGPPGSWTQATGPHNNTAEIGIARTPDGTLHLISPSTSGLAGSAMHNSIPASAVGVAGPHTILTYSGGINQRMALIRSGDGLRAFFSGLTGSESDPLQGVLATATSADGGSWSLQPTAASNNSPGGKSAVYSAAGISAALGSGGVPVSAWGDSAPGEAGYHFDLSFASADNRFSTECCVYAPNIGVDSVTGETVLAWQFLHATNGVAYQSISPAGTRIEPPGPSSGNNETRTAITGRIGASGIFLAYLFGDNQFTSIPAVVRTGTTDVIKFTRARGALHLGIAPAPAGKLWLFWVRNGVLYATRSNAAVSKFGALATVKPPNGTSTVYNLAGEGSLGALDLLALAETPAGIHNWHQRVLPKLTLAAKAGKGKVKLTVTDAGDPIKGAKVKVGKKSKKTNSKGVATFKLAKGKKKAKASKTGYAPATVTFKVK
ncbi:MAG: hypothetical protein HZB14_08195 [Actinobacteria bacterium]|nr:hypothetical protein [Actinomycetota bacterium]